MDPLIVQPSAQTNLALSKSMMTHIYEIFPRSATAPIVTHSLCRYRSHPQHIAKIISNANCVLHSKCIPMYVAANAGSLFDLMKKEKETHPDAQAPPFLEIALYKR